MVFRYDGIGEPVLCAVLEAEQRQVSDEVRHAGGAGAAPVHWDVGDNQDQKARIPCQVIFL